MCTQVTLLDNPIISFGVEDQSITRSYRSGVFVTNGCHVCELIYWCFVFANTRSDLARLYVKVSLVLLYNDFLYKTVHELKQYQL